MLRMNGHSLAMNPFYTFIQRNNETRERLEKVNEEMNKAQMRITQDAKKEIQTYVAPILRSSIREFIKAINSQPETGMQWEMDVSHFPPNVVESVSEEMGIPHRRSRILELHAMGHKERKEEGQMKTEDREKGQSARK